MERAVLTTEPVALAEAVRQAGHRAGLVAVGIASAQPFPATRRVLEERRRRGLHGGMAFTYRNPARSTDPARALPGVRRLVVGAWAYGGEGPSAPAGSWGRVARYARRDEYAELERALDAVAGVLSAAGHRTRVLVDDNALVDRAAAVRAGIGWYGKSANVLVPGVGSWVVLGAVLTDAPLPVRATPVPDRCGACRCCLDGCPTGAIVAPGVVDARRCLAWALQMTGPFPRALRVPLGDRLYGCDDCQEACPTSRRSPRGGGEAFVDLPSVIEASDAELLARFGRWYLPGREPRYLRRNALVALGNVGGPSDEPVLRRSLACDDGLVRAHAVWAAARLGRPDLLAGMAADPDPRVREELVLAPSVPRR